ncbi:hypothetical protein PJI20_10110 [Mycobacterium kansasii]
MVKTQSKVEARRAVRKAQQRAQEQRAQRDRDNVDDTAAFVVARSRLAAVDTWEGERIAQVRAEAERRREEHRSSAAAAMARIRKRGETIAAIAALADSSESEVRGYLKRANARGDGGGHPGGVARAVRSAAGAAAANGMDTADTPEG